MFRPAFNAPQQYPLVYYIGRTKLEDGQHSVTLSVRNVRYEYILTGPAADTTEFLCRKVSARKALNYAKSRASEVRKISAARTS
jgi:hypothetical protein